MRLISRPDSLKFDLDNLFGLIEIYHCDSGNWGTVCDCKFINADIIICMSTTWLQQSL